MKRLLSNGRYHECRGTRCLLKAKFLVSIQKLEIEQCTIESKTANTLYRAIGSYTISRFYSFCISLLFRKKERIPYLLFGSLLNHTVTQYSIIISKITPIVE